MEVDDRMIVFLFLFLFFFFGIDCLYLYLIHICIVKWAFQKRAKSWV